MPVSHLAQEAIAALVDGELSCGAAGRAARHLAGCAQCRMAVQAQREAKSALLDTPDVTVPTDLLSRLRDIPFTAEVPDSGSTVFTGPGVLGTSGASGSWSVPLEPEAPRRGQRWFRRGVVGMVAGLGLGVAVLAAGLPASPDGTTGGSVARPASPQERTEIVPPVVRTSTVGSVQPAAPGGAP